MIDPHLLFENIYDLMEANLVAQYKNTYPELYARHKTALTKNRGDLDSTRGLLGFRMMMKHQVQPTKVKQFITDRKRRSKGLPKIVRQEPQQDKQSLANAPTIPMKKQVDPNTSTVRMRRQVG